jgi:hypothetical protein
MSELLRFLGVLAGFCAISAVLLGHSKADGARNRFGERYETSVRGRRLSGELRTNGIRLTAWQWRCQQLVVMAVCIVGSAMAGLGLFGVGIAISLVRAGFAARRRVARRRYVARFRRAAMTMCTALAAELSLHVSLGDAVRRAAVAGSGERDLASEILLRASALVRAGVTPEPALRQSMEWWTGGIADTALLSLLSLVEGADGNVRASALERLAAGADADERNAGEVAGALAEARFVAFAIPVLAGVFAVGLVFANPASAAVLNSMLGVVVCALCITAAATGVMSVKRLTAQ